MPRPGAPLRLLAVLPLIVACGPTDAASDTAAEAACATPAVVEVVERLGARLQRVSVLAPDTILREEIRTTYGDLLTPELLDAWLAKPERAPGRSVSSPWPERIEVGSVSASGADECRVEAEVVYVARGAEAAQPRPVDRTAVVVRVRAGAGGWRIAAYEEVAPGQGAGSDSSAGRAGDGATTDPTPADQSPSDAPPGDSTAADAPAADAAAGAAPAEVIRAYYAAIRAREFRRAYELWGDGGRASGQSFEAFAAGFERTAQVEVEVGDPSRVEGAAGSRYVIVPVTVRAILEAGRDQRFEGTYTLRRAVVDGAPAAARRWRLHSADLVPRP